MGNKIVCRYQLNLLSGTPVLVTACEKGFLSIAQILVEKGANVNKTGTSDCVSVESE